MRLLFIEKVCSRRTDSEKDSDLCYKERESTGVQQLYTRALRACSKLFLRHFELIFGDIVKQKIHLYSCQEELCSDCRLVGSSRNAIYSEPFAARALYATSPVTLLGYHRKSLFCTLTCSPDVPPHYLESERYMWSEGN